MRKSCDVIRQVSRSPSSVVESERAEGAAAILATNQPGSSHLASYGKGQDAFHATEFPGLPDFCPI